jgi:hypothetical protein
MSHKIQITVDDQLNDLIQNGANSSGLSISSYARYILKQVLTKKGTNLLNEAMQDLKTDKVELLTLDKFNRQIDGL